jgi:hypothetical protein
MTTIDMSQYARSGDGFKFENIGDTLAGEIVQVKAPEVRTSKFTGKDETVMAVTVRTDSGDEFSIWPRLQPYSSMGGAIADATAEHGHQLKVGGRLAVQFTELMDTGKPQAAKIYAASYKPPTASVDVATAAKAKPILEGF